MPLKRRTANIGATHLDIIQLKLAPRTGWLTTKVVEYVPKELFLSSTPKYAHRNDEMLPKENRAMRAVLENQSNGQEYTKRPARAL
jgi:hypothetical protein